ncbi:MAG: hypothetical protein AAF694_20700 [Bacteroidota bacterium]
MKICIRTPVTESPMDVLERFDRTLFEALTPPGAQVELIRFDGSKMGDIVHLRLKLLGFIEQDWISDIIEDGSTEERAYFIDQGTQLPFFLTFWKHKHIVEKAEWGSTIVDDIEFKTPLWLPSFLLYPVLYAQFAFRKPIYQKFFGKGG